MVSSLGWSAYRDEGGYNPPEIHMPNSPDISRQYQAAVTSAGLYLRSDRGLIEVTGADRAAWLSNLVTNVIKTLQPGEGNYAFATNVKGRTVFDLNVLVLDDRLWLDVAGPWRATALKHFEKYIITEDVKLADRSAEFSRGAVMGPRAGDVVSALGFGNLGPMSQLQHLAGRVGGEDVRMVRHDFAGLVTAEFIVPGESADPVVASIAGAVSGLTCERLSDGAVEVLRIEAGIPASVVDIDEEVVPPETCQVERGISYHKGCYLGQEVIERMRSHGILARKLVGLRIEGQTPSPAGSIVKRDDKEVGRVTSACWSEALGGPLALGYLKSIHAQPDTQVTINEPSGSQSAIVAALPVRPRA